MRNEYANLFLEVQKLDNDLFLCLESMYSIDTIKINVPSDLCPRLKVVSADLVDFKVTDIYLELRQIIKELSTSKSGGCFNQIIDWYFWSTNLFFALSEREADHRPIPVQMNKVDPVNSILSECKSSYISVLQEIKKIDDEVFRQLVSCFDPFSKYVPLSPDFIRRLVLVVEKIDVVHLGKCKKVLTLDSIPIADIAEWEIIATLFGFISNFCILLEKVSE